MILALDVGGLRLLFEQFVVQAHLEAGEIGLGAAQLQLGVEQLLQHRSSRSSRMIVSAGMMLALGSVTMRSTVASVAAVTQRMSSGTSVPGPRTWRSIGPRLAESRQVVAPPP